MESVVVRSSLQVLMNHSLRPLRVNEPPTHVSGLSPARYRRLPVALAFKPKCQMDRVILRLSAFPVTRVMSRRAHIVLCLGYDPDSPEHVAKDRFVGAVLHIDGSRFPLEWLKDEDGFLMTTDMMTQGDLGAFRERWKTLARKLCFPFIVGREVDRVFQGLPSDFGQSSQAERNSAQSQQVSP